MFCLPSKEVCLYMDADWLGSSVSQRGVTGQLRTQGSKYCTQKLGSHLHNQNHLQLHDEITLARNNHVEIDYAPMKATEGKVLLN